jgi:hypothetical protein
MILVKSLQREPDMIQTTGLASARLFKMRNLKVLFCLHLSESPCKEEHKHWGSRVEVPYNNSISCSNSYLLECSPVTQATQLF